MRTFLLILLFPLAVPALTFETWIASYNLSTTQSLPSADPDKDQVPNILEFGLSGRSPVVCEGTPVSLSLSEPPLANSQLTWTPRSTIAGVRLTAQYSNDDMEVWQSFGDNSNRLFARLKAVHSRQFGEWSDQIDNRLAEHSSGSLSIFSEQDHTNSVYVRNTECWGADIDLTPISPWNSTGGTQRGGVLVSPRHVLFATHWRPQVSAALRFVAADNTTVTRTLEDVVDLPTTSTLFPDVSVGVLDSDVPAGVEHVKVLPSNWRNQLPDFAGFNLPGVGTDQENKLFVTEIRWLTDDGKPRIQMQIPTQGEREDKFELVVSGDSGKPFFLVADGHLVLLGLWSVGGPGSGTFVTEFVDEINGTMSTLGGGYQLTTLSP